MRLFTAILLAVTLVVASRPALAQDVPAEPRRVAVEARLLAFDEAVARGSIADGVAFLPPGVIGVLAAELELTPAEARVAAREAFADTLQDITIVVEGHALSAIEVHTTPDGRRTYLTAPFTMGIQAGELRGRATSQTIILEDEGEWWLITVNAGPMGDLFLEAYPEFEGVEFPGDDFEVMD